MRQKKPSAIAEMTVAAIAVALLLAPCAMAANTYKVVHRFNGQDGAAPFAALILDAAGNFYGTTSSGGTLGGGTVFKLTPIANGSWTESVLYNLPGGPGGYFPYAGLTLDSVGNLYGAAALGGNTSCNNIGGCGTIFKLTSNADGSWTPSVLHTFTGGDGDGPYGNLVFDAAGQNLYGTTVAGGSGAECPGGCGVVFKLAPNSDGSWTESVLHSFTGESMGNCPEPALSSGREICTVQPSWGVAAPYVPVVVALSLSWNRTRVGIGRRASCIVSRVEPTGQLLTTRSSSTPPEIFTARPVTAVPAAVALFSS
jgi:uncharacterized repeat protein (TIGR03803 family)